MNGKITFILIVVLLLIAGFFTITLISTDLDENLVITDSRLVTNDTGGRVALGVVKNQTKNETYDMVKIEISFLNDAGMILGTTTVVTEPLSPGEAWQFESSTAPEGATNYRADIINL